MSREGDVACLGMRLVSGAKVFSNMGSLSPFRRAVSRGALAMHSYVVRPGGRCSACDAGASWRGAGGQRDSGKWGSAGRPARPGDGDPRRRRGLARLVLIGADAGFGSRQRNEKRPVPAESASEALMPVPFVAAAELRDGARRRSAGLALVVDHAVVAAALDRGAVVVRGQTRRRRQQESQRECRRGEARNPHGVRILHEKAGANVQRGRSP